MMKKIAAIIKANFQQVMFVFFAFLAMVLFSFSYVGNIVQGQMLALGEETMNTMQTAVSASLAEAELVFANVTQNVESRLRDGEGNARILAYLRETNDYYSEGHSSLTEFLKLYAYLGGEFLDGSGWVPPDDYSPPQRPWHIGALASGDQIFFSDPYIDADTGGMCISFSKQVYNRAGAAAGVVAIDLNLTRITDYIAGQQIANDGYGVMLDDDMRFTSHKNPALIGVRMDEAGQGYEGLAFMLENGEAVAAERFRDVDGTDSVAFFRTVFNGWHIGVFIPRDSYYRQVYSLARELAILGFILMVALSYMLIRTRVEKMRADEESRSKSSFLARMSHEMRTPLNAVIGMTGVARRSDDMDKVQGYLTKIDDAANHLLGVINDVLDMSKIEAGKLELSPTNFLFAEMVRQVVTVVEFKVDEKQQHFTLEIDERVPRAIVADRQRLAQVITNLLGNATKFTPEQGHIALRISRVDTGDDGDFCTLRTEVADDGIGISGEQQARLFRSFEQADGSISRRYGGTGLGLAISKSIIDMMDGTAEIESEPGKGARFIFTVRVGVGNTEEALREGESEAPRAAQGPPSFLGMRVLLAEDVEVNREVLAAMLEGTGVDIDFAEDGEQAVEMFLKDSCGYDIIFMDIHMPRVDGFEATRRIRAAQVPCAGTVPIVAMTANVFREDIEKCLECGMNDHLGKPLDMDEVLAKLEKYARKNRS